MAVLPIPQAPNSLLRRKTAKVKNFDISLRKLVNDMIDTMRSANGVGLAANQVGVSLRVAVIEMPDEEEGSGKVHVLINPEILRCEGEREVVEGCLSIPGYRGTFKRSMKVRVRARDLDGKEIRFRAENNLLAEALEHEIDHLNGVLYIDHLDSQDALELIPSTDVDAPDVDE